MTIKWVRNYDINWCVLDSFWCKCLEYFWDSKKKTWHQTNAEIIYPLFIKRASLNKKEIHYLSINTKIKCISFHVSLISMRSRVHCEDVHSLLSTKIKKGLILMHLNLGNQLSSSTLALIFELCTTYRTTSFSATS